MKDIVTSRLYVISIIDVRVIIFIRDWLQCAKSRMQEIFSDQANVMERNILKSDTTEDNNNYYEGLRGGRPSPSAPNSLVSATRIINHHLFGSLSESKHGAGKYIRPQLARKPSFASVSLGFLIRILNRSQNSWKEETRIFLYMFSNIHTFSHDKLLTILQFEQ